MTYQSKSLVQAIDYNTLVGATGTGTISATPTPTSGIAYGTDPLQTVDILSPSTFNFATGIGDAPKGVILWLHGGTQFSNPCDEWGAGDKTLEASNISNVNTLVQAGYLVINANYRLVLPSTLDSSPSGVFPNNTLDVLTIMSFLLVDGQGQSKAPTTNDQNAWVNARNYVKKHGLMVAGAGAGGHLAMLGTFEFAYASNGIWPNAVMNFMGPMNLVYDSVTNPLGTDAQGAMNVLTGSSSTVLHNASPYYRRSTWASGIPNYLNAPCKFYFWYNTNDTLFPSTSILGFANALATDIPSKVFINSVTVGTETAGTGGYPTQYLSDHNVSDNTLIPSALISSAKLSLPLAPTSTVTANTVNAVWGTGNGSLGYGQPSLSLIDINQEILAQDWINLINVINYCATAQGTTISPAITLPVANSYASKVTADQNIISGLSSIYTKRLNTSRQGTSSSASTATLNNSWNSVATFQHDITFSSGDQARYFFNMGGQIALTLATPNGAGTINGDLYNLANACGTLYLSSGTCTINNTAFNGFTKVGGSGTPSKIVPTAGYYGLTSTYQEIFNQQVGGNGPTASSYVSISAKTNGTQDINGDNGTVISLQITWAEIPAGTGTVTSGTSTSVVVTQPYLFSNFVQSWGLPVVTSTALGGTTITVAQPALTPVSINPNPVTVGGSTTISSIVSNAIGKTWTMTVIGPAGTNLSYNGSVTTNPQTITQNVTTSVVDSATVTITLNSGQSVTGTLVVNKVPAKVYNEVVSLPTPVIINTDLVIGISGGAPSDTCVITGLDYAMNAPGTSITVNLDVNGNGSTTVPSYGGPTSPYSIVAKHLGATFNVTFTFTNTTHVVTKPLTVNAAAVPPSPTYLLAATETTILPGQNVEFVLTTTNVPAGTSFPFTIAFSTGVGISDFSPTMSLNGSMVAASPTGNFIVGKAGVSGEAKLIFATSATSQVFASGPVGVTVTINANATQPKLTANATIGSIFSSGPSATVTVENESITQYLLSGLAKQYVPQLNDPNYAPGWNPGDPVLFKISPGWALNDWHIDLSNFLGGTDATLSVIYTDAITGDITQKALPSAIFSAAKAKIDIPANSPIYTDVLGISNTNRFIFCMVVINGANNPNVQNNEVYPYYYYFKISTGSPTNTTGHFGVSADPELAYYPWYINGPYADVEYPLALSGITSTPWPQAALNVLTAGATIDFGLSEIVANQALPNLYMYAMGGKYSAGYTWSTTGITSPGIVITPGSAGYRQKILNISGTPTVAGDFQGTVTVTSNGKSTTANVKIHVKPNESAIAKGTVISVGDSGTHILLAYGYPGDTVTVSATFIDSTNRSSPITPSPSTITLDNNGSYLYPVAGYGSIGILNYQFSFSKSGTVLSVGNGKVTAITVQAGSVPPSPKYIFSISPANTTLSAGQQFTITATAINVTYPNTIYYTLSGVNSTDVLWSSGSLSGTNLALNGPTIFPDSTPIPINFNMASTSDSTTKTAVINWYSSPSQQDSSTLLGSINWNTSWSLGTTTTTTPNTVNSGTSVPSVPPLADPQGQWNVVDSNNTPYPNGSTIPQNTQIYFQYLGPAFVDYTSTFNGSPGPGGTSGGRVRLVNIIGPVTLSTPGPVTCTITYSGYIPQTYNATVTAAVSAPPGVTLPNYFAISPNYLVKGNTATATIQGTHDVAVTAHASFQTAGQDPPGTSVGTINLGTIGTNGQLSWTSPQLNSVGTWYFSVYFGGTIYTVDDGNGNQVPAQYVVQVFNSQADLIAATSYG